MSAVFNTTELSSINQIIAQGYSLITADKNKRPLNSWKEAQTNAIDEDGFKSQFHSKGYDGVCGIVAGYNDLEVMDVDLKVFSTEQEQKEWFDEYVSFLEDNIADFNDKFVIYKTKNKGYHILYKTKRVEGNLKVAKLKGHSQQVLETRGAGGYVVIYQEALNSKTYLDIQYISDEDREILFAVSRSFNYVDEDAIEMQKSPPKPSNMLRDGLTTWEDYNTRGASAEELLVGAGFSVVRRLKDRVVIKRAGAESAYSGYIFNDSGIAYFHSTGTQFDSNKGLTPFSIYTTLNHNGDFSASAKYLYSQGYGDRIERDDKDEFIDELSIEEVAEVVVIDDEEARIREFGSFNPTFPIHTMPQVIQDVHTQIINEGQLVPDFAMMGLLSGIGGLAGKGILVSTIANYKSQASIFGLNVSVPSVGKTESTLPFLQPILDLSTALKIDFEKRNAEYEELSDENKKKADKPVDKSFVLTDVTTEALIAKCAQVPRGILVYMDEGSFLFDSLNMYKQGGGKSDVNKWIQFFNGNAESKGRVGTGGVFASSVSVGFIGTIQPSRLNPIYAENKGSGFMYRFSLMEGEGSPRDAKIDDKPVDLSEYVSLVGRIHDRVDKFKLTVSNDKSVLDTPKARVTHYLVGVAKQIFLDTYNFYNRQKRNPNLTKTEQEMYGKLAIKLGRYLAIIVTVWEQRDGAVSAEMVRYACDICDWEAKSHIDLVKKAVREQTAKKIVDSASNGRKAVSNKDKVFALLRGNSTLSNKEIAEALEGNVNSRTISNYKLQFKKLQD